MIMVKLANGLEIRVEGLTLVISRNGSTRTEVWGTLDELIGRIEALMGAA